jgi:hypothetical protein
MLPSGGEDRLATGQSYKTRPMETNKITKDHVHLPVVSYAYERVVDPSPASIKQCRNKYITCDNNLSHPNLKTNPSTNQMCARIKSHTYDDSWYINECHNFII